MKILELFAGTKSFSKVAEQLGHETFTVDIDPRFECDYTVDIMDFDFKNIPFIPDVIWASPPCTCFSVASIGTHWGGGKRAYVPKTENAVMALKIVQQTLNIINAYPDCIYFIENPRGVLRKLPVMEGLHRKTVTYCQYGDTRMKPTDIWTNSNWTPRPMCKNGDPCHVSAPRGSKTGTQGLKGSILRSIVPPELCLEILKSL